RTIEMFERHRLDVVVANVAGCGSTLKEYGGLLADDPEYRERAEAFSARVRDVSELLAELSPLAPRHPLRIRVAYHDACHLSNAQGVREQPRRVLRSVPGLEVADIAEAETCCGSAGVYSLVQPHAPEEPRRRTAGHLTAARPGGIATASARRPLPVRRYLDQRTPPAHPVQPVGGSIRGTGRFGKGAGGGR